jgi:hypothetical protein
VLTRRRVFRPGKTPGKPILITLAAALSFALLISFQTLFTASTVAASGNVRLVEYPATISLSVVGIASQNGGAAAGTAEMGDTFSVTFNQALNTASFPATGTISLTGAGSTATIVISGLTTPDGFQVPKYEQNKNTSTAAAVAFSFSNGNRTVTATITSAFSNPSAVGSGRASTFTFTPSTTITSVGGTAASGSYTTPTALLLF